MSALTSLARREPEATNEARASEVEDDEEEAAAAGPLGRIEPSAAAPDAAAAVLGGMAWERLEEQRRKRS